MRMLSAKSAANERTLLAWLSMAVTIGSVSAALVGFTASEKDVKGMPSDHQLQLLHACLCVCTYAKR